ncbi:MAG TPA: hypothetical protein VL463_23745 [Kofleriaceae bacterium]|nr:hypothetical protein [Kofleriaceae bacterium]
MGSDSGAALVRIAALRSRIAVLGRGGEYETATRLLLEHVAEDLGIGLNADSVRRAHQAAALASREDDPVAAAETMLVLGASLIQAGEGPDSAARAAELASDRAAHAPEADRRRLLPAADLVLGMAERARGRFGAARQALDRARERAARLAMPTLTAAILVELGLVDLGEGHADAAATCFWFARDFYRLAKRPVEAARAAAMPLVGYAAASRWADLAALAPAIADDAAAHDLHELAARVRGMLAEAAVHLASGDALELARAAADAATALPESAARRELAVRGRLRLMRLSDAPLEQLRHLEAALDLGASARDVPLLADVTEAILTGLAEARLPPGASEVIAELATVLRRLGASELADLAEAALTEIQSSR